ncbi:MAG: twin-arginine translocation signal domain-containing protein, partial [Berryella intestinalis]|nr:twin-arginine translocation signal domain-containing protein [Berryella intestinalis]
MPDTNLSASAAEEQTTSADAAATTAESGSTDKKTITRRNVLALAGTGVAGLVAGGVLATWGVTQERLASGELDL